MVKESSFRTENHYFEEHDIYPAPKRVKEHTPVQPIDSSTSSSTSNINKSNTPPPITTQTNNNNTTTSSSKTTSAPTKENINNTKPTSSSSTKVSSTTTTKSQDKKNEQQLVESTTTKPQTQSATKSFIAGGFGGMCLVFVGHPFDTVKVRLQATNDYSGAMDCARRTVAKEGVKGLYKGMLTPLVGSTPIFAVCFWGYDIGQKLWRKMAGYKPNEKLGAVGIMAAGGFSAVPTTLLMTPIERIKIVLQTQGINVEKGIPAKYNGPLDAAQKIVKEGGIKSLYRGTAATLIRDCPASVAYFGAYEFFKKMLTKKDGTISNVSVLFAGGMAGVANWTVAIPPDVLKSRLQSAPEGTYNGITDVFQDLMKKEGPTALFKGLGPAMLRAFPANAACFFGVEMARKFLDKLW